MAAGVHHYNKVEERNILSDNQATVMEVEFQIDQSKRKRDKDVRRRNETGKDLSADEET